MDIPLPWERLLWRGRPAFAAFTRERYFLTDFRLIRQTGRGFHELVLHDIGDVGRTESGLDPILGTSTLIVRAHDTRRPPLVLRRVRKGPHIAALLELLAGEPTTLLDAAAVNAALAWNPQKTTRGFGQTLTAVGLVLLAVFGIVAGLHGTSSPRASFAADDAIYPGGHKRDRADIMRYMEDEILPWARETLGPLKGGSDKVTCETCHGRRPSTRDWRMPAVAALPQPDVRDRGWEQYGGPMDAQIRNAIYGYLAESSKQAKAAYMREVVLPGMAGLLHRPAYDFTRPYEYNRSRLAFGCYHCHLVN
ncbi:MAG: hypothetical protein ABJA98_07710 [Acidobacteriota bacterium]